jgi:hypothetical protein
LFISKELTFVLLLIAVIAVNRLVSSRLERDFALFAALSADGSVHFPVTP